MYKLKLNVHAVMAGGEWRNNFKFLNFDAVRRRGQLHSSATVSPHPPSPEERAPVTTEQEAMWEPEPVCRLWGREKNLPCARNQP